MRLEVRNIHFAYDSNPVLCGVDLCVREGEILCILGPNGSGKTTLFKAILGLVKLKKGEVTFDNISIDNMSRIQMAKMIGYVPQSHDPPFPFKVKDVILMGRTPYISSFSEPRTRDYEAVERVIESLKIQRLADKIYTQLSGGERQLVLIARALAQNPHVLVMDEPTSSLDYGNQLMVLSHIQSLASSGLAVVMISHMPEHALLYSHRVVLFKNGKIRGNGNPEDVITAETMRLLYGIDTSIVTATLKNGQTMKICVPEKTNGGNLHEKIS